MAQGKAAEYSSENKAAQSNSAEGSKVQAAEHGDPAALSAKERAEQVRDAGLVTEDLCVGYGKRVVVDGINLTILPGQVLTLIGPNGAGKSTILKSIAGQLRTLGGRVFFTGEDAAHLSGRQRARTASMVTTERIHPEHMSGREVVETGRYPYTGRMGILSKEDHEAADEAICMLNAQDVADQPFDELSDGQRQRLLLARAICQDTDILVLDEPTSYLDLHYKLEMLMQIRRLAGKRQLSVIMSLHELDLARQVSDLIACVERGRIGRIGTPDDIFTGSYIAELFGIDQSCLDPRLGILNLKGSRKPPRVFVICGGGSGIPVFHALVRQNIPFAAGILQQNDLDYPFAERMASRVVSVSAFTEISAAEEAGRKLIDACKSCIVPLETFGPENEANRRLAMYAERQGKIR